MNRFLEIALIVIVTQITSFEGLSQNIVINGYGGLGFSLVAAKNSDQKKLDNQIGLSYVIGVEFSKKISSSFDLRADLLFQKIEGREFTVNYIDNNYDDGITGHYGINHRNYIGIPVFIEYGESFKIGIGMQLLKFLNGNERVEINGEYFIDDFVVIFRKIDERRLGLVDFDFGPKLNLELSLYKNWSIFLDIYMGLINTEFISNEWVRKNRQMNIGLSRRF